MFDPIVWEALKLSYPRKTSQFVEELVIDNLGISVFDKENELILLKNKSIKLNEDINKMEMTIEKSKIISKKRLNSIWNDFRKRFTRKQDNWKNDIDIVTVLQKDYNITMTYRDLYCMWDTMDEKNKQEHQDYISKLKSKMDNKKRSNKHSNLKKDKIGVRK